MKRHIARLVNTDQRVVVVLMQIPNREDHALVVATDNLPTRWEQLIQSLVESKEGQGEMELASVLGRRMMPDSTESIMQSLHNNGLLVAVPIQNVIMMPRPNMPLPLKEVLKAMGKILPEPADPSVPVAQQQPVAEKYNAYTTNQKADASNADVGIADALLIEAAMLEDDARSKRERAYQYAPHLRPKATARASATVAQVAEVKVKATAKRTAAKRSTPTRAKKAKAAG